MDQLEQKILQSDQKNSSKRLQPRVDRTLYLTSAYN